MYENLLVWEGKRLYYTFSFIQSSVSFSASINKLSFGIRIQKFYRILLLIQKSHLYRFTVYVTGNFSVSAVELKEFRSIGDIPGTLRTLTNAGVPSGFMRERETSRENSGSLRRRRWCRKAGGGESWRRFVTWLGRQTDLSFRLHGGLLGGRGVHYSFLILGREEWSKLGRRRRERSGTRHGYAGEESNGRIGSKKERNVNLTRDLPHTINCGGAEIIRDFIAVTCDANKSFVPITRP